MHDQNTNTHAPLRLMRLPEVLSLTGLSKSTIWRMCNRGDFPKSRKLPGIRATWWPAHEVEDWLAQAAG